ncbi:hypothetical protein TUMSATVNIG1_60010 (plasmid) [Vibrio nigripulchritudo]|uniref:hypothetical protein n=1 Tax=Vibrio nigripulchritudo TaxID=28173 RepID=UPI00190B7DD1|nr:hypothetical protein [Vibrio nigripulchritudo]BCL74015.1 hypothetical protein VNTUMSATTG_59520 [Vibrio nigripulchritudo]BDU35392.1 hypothetical protein TUMSATVNIG1_60010 [Vibrio nigripulchritudo]
MIKLKKILAFCVVYFALSPSAFASKGIEYYGEKFVQVITWATGMVLLVMVSVGIWLIATSIPLLLKASDERSQDPTAGTKAMWRIIIGLVAMSLTALIVALVVSFFGATTVVEFALPSGKSTGDLINWSQGQN